jgi:hypothetical protein
LDDIFMSPLPNFNLIYLHLQCICIHIMATRK